MKALIVIVAMVGVAQADNWQRRADRARGVAWLHYELDALAVVEDGPHQAPVRDLVLASAHLHGFVGEGRTVGFHAGFDLGAGATVGGGGFAYDVALFPLGIGVHLRGTSFVSLGTGIAAMGATGVLDDAVALPIEAMFEYDRGGRLRFLSRLRASWLAGAPSRHDGAPSVAFADELEAMAGVRIGHHYEQYGYPSGNGYFVGLSYRELLAARYLGITLGYSIDLGTR